MRARLIAVPLALALALAGCHESREPPTAEVEVRRTLERFAAASRAGDYGSICRDLFAKALLDRLSRIGLPCAVALQEGLGGREDLRLEVRRVRVTNGEANAEVRSTARGEPPSTDVVALRREGGSWRIADLAGAQPPAPPGPSSAP